MPPHAQSRFWRRLRLAFRGFRVTVWLLILALLGGLIYLNRSGVPDFVKRPLLENLRARGLDVEMSRLRLRFYRGLVAENVKFGRAESPDSPRFTAKSLDVNLNYLALAKRQLEVTAVVLNQGRLAWPVADGTAPPRELAVENIHATLRLLPGDEWVLDHFQAVFAGANLTLSGTVTNASAVRDWPFFQGKQPAGTTQRRLRRFAETLEKINFATPPNLNLKIDGDARAPRSFIAHISLTAPDADTPWARITEGVFTAQLFPATNNELVYANLSLQARDAQTPWATVAGLDLKLQLVSPAIQTNAVDAGLTMHAARAETKWANATDLDLVLHLVSPAGQTNLVNADLTAKAAHASILRSRATAEDGQTRWASVTNAQFTANWIHSLTNAIPLSGRGELRSVSLATPWVGGRKLSFSATLATPTNPPPADASWAWWTNLQPFHLDWAGELSQPDTEKLDAKRIICAGRWRPPELAVTNLHVDFPVGRLDARAQLDVATREARFDLKSNFDVQKISPLLTDKSRRLLENFSWRNPPVLAGHAAVVLPAWANRQPDWRGEVLPTLQLAGEVFVTNTAYLNVPVDWAHTHFICSNLVWQLPDFEMARPEGGVRLAHRTDTRTKEFYWHIRSTVDPRALRPLLATNEQSEFDLVTLTQPPVIDGEVWGRWHELDRIGFQGHVALTNFSFRGQSASWVETSARYTNRFLEFLDPHLMRGTQTLSAAGIAVDFNTQRIHFTNGFSTAEPLVVARAIGAKIGQTLEPYVFTRPPRVRVSGYAPLRGSRDADLHFDVDGGPFEWWKFKVPHVTGEVHWLGEALTLTNVHVAFYGGSAAGFAQFDFTPERGDDLSFTFGVTNASLPALVGDLFTPTNRLEGALSGRLVITHANTAAPSSWTGAGRARLRDGFLWEIPIFGILSKPLDVIMPGVANSRFTEASGRFTVTNGAIAWDKLEMRAPTMRLQYDGLVNLDGRVDMRVEVEPLRDTWVVGRIFSLALWPVTKLFQYRVTGTLSEPKSEPVYVPKLLMMPLHPFRTLEDIFSPDPDKTNAPPVFKELPGEN